MEKLLAARLYFWLLVIHLALFWRQEPWSFFAGLMKWPCYFVRGICKKNQKAFVIGAVNLYCDCIENGEVHMPPKCLMRRLQAVAGM